MLPTPAEKSGPRGSAARSAAQGDLFNYLFIKWGRGFGQLQQKARLDNPASGARSVAGRIVQAQKGAENR